MEMDVNEPYCAQCVQIPNHYAAHLKLRQCHMATIKTQFKKKKETGDVVNTVEMTGILPQGKHAHLPRDVPIQCGCLPSSLDGNRDAVVWKPCRGAACGSRTNTRA